MRTAVRLHVTAHTATLTAMTRLAIIEAGSGTRDAQGLRSRRRPGPRARGGQVVDESRRGALVLPGFVFDVEANELRRDDGQVVNLRPQCLAVLRCLAQAPGQVVTKEALIAAVWRDVVVTDDSLVQCVAALRRALGDGEHRIIQTEPKRGYRLRARDEAAAVVPLGRTDREPEIPQVRFATAPDGVRIAYAVTGDGPPLVRTARWMSHLEHEWNCLTEAPLLHELSRRFRLLRYDQRGQGLSDRGVLPGGPEVRARDLIAAVDAAGFERFSLLGSGLVGVVIATQFARLCPERVERLILVSASARGVAKRGDRSQPKANRLAWLQLIADNWDDDDPLVRQMITTRHHPDASRAQMDSYNELLRRSCSAAGVADYIVLEAHTDVSADVARIPWPTLLIHSAANVNLPLEEGRLVAAQIPGARFRTIDSRGVLPLPGEPSFDELLRMIEGFVLEDHRVQPATRVEPAATSARGASLRLVAGARPESARVRRRD